jgi:hypothetical protein
MHEMKVVWIRCNLQKFNYNARNVQYKKTWTVICVAAKCFAGT